MSRTAPTYFALVRFALFIAASLSFPATGQRVVAAPSPASAQPAARVATAPLTPEQALARRQIQDLRVAPGGERVAFTVTEPPRGDRSDRHIWVLDLKTREARRFTNSAKSEWAPRWSPDGRWLAFLSDRDGKARLWLMRGDAGEAERLAQEEAAGDGVEWSPDGKAIAYLAKEPKAEAEAEEKREKEKDDARVVDRDDKPQRLFLVDVASRKSRLVTPSPWKVEEAVWAPGGDRLILIATDHPESDRWTDRIVSFAIADGAITALASPPGPLRSLRVSRDGGSLAYVASRSGGPEPEDLFVVPLGGGGQPPDAARDLTGESVDRTVETLEWRREGGLLALAQTGLTSRIYAVSPAGRAEALPALPATATDFAILEPAEPPGARRTRTTRREGREDFAFIAGSADEQPEVWLSRGGAAERITHLNEGWKTVALARQESLRYRSFDGREIEAALLRPANAREGERAPLIVLAHGGPTGRWADRFDAWGQLLAARGFAVLYPNVRGSTGYGHQFVLMNRGDWGGGDFKDLMTGVDVLIERGIADADHLGIGGWSYGGYMAMWAVTQTSRFRGAVAGAGLSDLASEFGTEDEPAYDEWYYGLPYESPAGFAKSSPLTYVKAARTPTLILQGEADAIDPIGQSQEFYRALKRYGAPAELVLYPREGHLPKEEKHRLDVLSRIIGWCEKYVK
jgi:dipeptidyl aminopeptidase/acylaminoacyl peptidase